MVNKAPLSNQLEEYAKGILYLLIYIWYVQKA